jgi:hypothetical protein
MYDETQKGRNGKALQKITRRVGRKHPGKPHLAQPEI